ncbi:unnamed protein product, partial [Protopolystoma xenopodis]
PSIHPSIHPAIRPFINSSTAGTNHPVGVFPQCEHVQRCPVGGGTDGQQIAHYGNCPNTPSPVHFGRGQLVPLMVLTTFTWYRGQLKPRPNCTCYKLSALQHLDKWPSLGVYIGFLAHGDIDATNAQK